MSSWFFVKDGQRNGPLSRAELDARVADGEVGADTLVWRAGMDRWTRAGELPDLGVPPPLPPLPPPLPSAGMREPESAFEPAAEPVESGASRERPAPEYAGFWVRFAAKVVDFAILSGIGRGVEWGVARWVFEGPIPAPPDWAGLIRAALWLVSINTLVALVYGVFFQVAHEATPGKRMLGLRVVRADGSRVGGWRAAGRYWAEQLSGLTFLAGYVMAAFDEEKRALHDHFCDTRVVKGPRAEPGHSDTV